MMQTRRGVLASAAALCAVAAGPAAPAAAQAPITLHGAVQFNDDHAFNKGAAAVPRS